MDDAISIALVKHGTAKWWEAVRLREAVLRAPLGLAFDADELARETTQLHLAARVAGQLAGVAVLVPPDAGSTWKLRQMAVAPPYRGQGLGRLLVRAAEREAQDRGATAMTLHAREEAAAFYARLGYVARGAIFTEVTLPHRRMDREFAYTPREPQVD